MLTMSPSLQPSFSMLELDEMYASVILRRYAEMKQNGGVDITCERDGKVYPYADLVKAVALI